MNLILAAFGIKTEYGQGKDILLVCKGTLQALLSSSSIILVGIYYILILELVHAFAFV